MPKRARWGETAGQRDIFSSTTDPHLSLTLAQARWPSQADLPVNHNASRVRDQVWTDLVKSRTPLVWAGFASIAKIIELVALARRKPDAGHVRILLGTEPFSSERIFALCSDAMHEGINLQGASVIVHFDMPTTLRIAEQRVGRVDRMDSPYERIASLVAGRQLVVRYARE